jgi:protein SCO1/2
MAYFRLLVVICIVAGVSAGHAATGAQPYERDDALEISQAAIARQLGDYSLRDVDGQPFDLAQLRGKPLVISMIYTSCHHICPTITRNLGDTIDVAQEALGEDSFSVITVGFDWKVDTPERMRQFAAGLGMNDVPNWHFLATEAGVVDKLSENLGFLFYPSAKGFDHLAQATVIDADGKRTSIQHTTKRRVHRALDEHLQTVLHGLRSEQRPLSFRLLHFYGDNRRRPVSWHGRRIYRQGMAARAIGALWH